MSSLVKDYNKHGFEVSDEFMTNGDVPTIAVSGLIDNPVNPFTGKIIDDTEKRSHEQYVTCSVEWDTAINNGYQFLPSDWLAVKDNIWDKNNWRIVARNTVFIGNE